MDNLLFTIFMAVNVLKVMFLLSLYHYLPWDHQVMGHGGGSGMGRAVEFVV